MTAWYKGIVEVVAEYSETVSSPSVTINLPAVVRLKRALPSKKKSPKFSRLGVYTRDKWTCSYCGKKFTFSELTYDHLTPRSRGGRTEWNNIVSACEPCNSRKGNKTCDEASMWPRVEPYEPKSLPLSPSPIDVSHEIQPEWLPWLKKNT